MLDRFAAHLPSASLGMLPTASDALLDELRDKMRTLLTTPGGVVPEPITVDFLNRIMTEGMEEPFEREFIPLLLE